MPMTLEDRIRELEHSRYVLLGEINAMRTVALSAWMTLIARGSTKPKDAIEQMRASWFSTVSHPLRSFPGQDPAYLDAISQEYETALKDFLSLLENAIVPQEER